MALKRPSEFHGDNKKRLEIEESSTPEPIVPEIANLGPSLLVIDSAFKAIQDQIHAANIQQLAEYREDLSELYDYVNDMVDNKLPQIKRNVHQTDLRVESRIKQAEKKIFEQVESLTEEFKDTTSNTVKEVRSLLDSRVHRIRESIDQKYNREHGAAINELREEVFGILSKKDFDISVLGNKINEISESYDALKEETEKGNLISEGLLNGPLDPSDPLSKTEFVTIDQLNKHYSLFVNRVQEQLSTLGGGGETRLQYLDDIAGIATNASAYDGMFLRYDHATKKFLFSTVTAPASDFALYANVAGVSTVATTATNLADAANIVTGTVDPARLSGTYNISVTNSDTANSATNANFATRAGIVTYAEQAGIATNASVATYAATAGIASEATTAQGLTGIAATATYAATAGISTFASTAGIATFANRADIQGEKSVLYVAKDGNDANTGELTKPKLTIKGAVQKIIDEGLSDTVVRVAPGSYVEDNPIVLPNEVSVIGASLRETTVTPLNADKDIFHVGNANYIAEMSFTGTQNEGKAVVAFDPENKRYISRSTYVQNCTNFIPYNIGMKIDGDHAIGPLKSMVVDSYTQYNQGGIGCSITNNAYAQLVSMFTICSDTAIFTGSGGACDLSNSNSSFGTYGLVADGVSDLSYTGVVTTASAENSDVFAINLNNPTFNVVDATYDHTTGLLRGVTDSPHNFIVGAGVTINGLQFICTSSGVAGTAFYPSGNLGYVFNAEAVSDGTYYNAYELIVNNRQEIIDRSVAQIPVEHPDFYYPNDPQTGAWSRYKDAYRLIQKNRADIVQTAYDEIGIQHPGFTTDPVKCQRDIGYFIDAVSLDVNLGGNVYARKFILQYFNNGSPINNGLVGEETESITAFNKARDEMKRAITNQLAYKDLTVTPGESQWGDGLGVVGNTDANACADVQSNIDTLTSTITTVINDGNLTNLPSETVGGNIPDGESKCRRDTGYIVDALSLDVRDYTTKNIIENTKRYFTLDGTAPITMGLAGETAESITAFNKVRDVARQAITNQLYYKDLTIAADPVTGFNTDPNSCANVQTFIGNVVGILTTRIEAGNIVGANELPAVSAASTVFTLDVGISTIAHTYVSGGTAALDVVRPHDGQVIYFDRLYNTVKKVNITDQGTYTTLPAVTFSEPETPWGIKATGIPVLEQGKIVAVEMISNGRGYVDPPTVTFSTPQSGINTAVGKAEILPTYYTISKATAITNDVSLVTLTENVPFAVNVGTAVNFFKQSRILATSHSFEFIGSGIDITRAIPYSGGLPPIAENETDSRNGGLVIYTSTNQAGNFKIGDGVIINQVEGKISGQSYSKSLVSTMTPYILSLGGF